MQPVLASSAYTSPRSDAVKMRPPTTVGCVLAASEPAKPKAHFSVSFGTSAAVKLADAGAWYRVFWDCGLHPFHAGPASCGGSAAVVVHRLGSDDEALASGRPPRNSATARRSAADKASPWTRMRPVVSAVTIASGAS
jgi:hypothetical protein